MLYFDHNASAPLGAVARAAWLEATERFPGNPSSPHRVGARAARALEEARERLAGLLGCKAGEIVWTSGATEAVNLALGQFAGDGGTAWVSAIEHPCVLAAARRAFGLHRVEEVPVSREGVVSQEWIQKRLEEGVRPTVVAMMAANNETGVRQPWDSVREICAQAGVPFLCDAAQWLGRLSAKGLGQCDLVSGCGHKAGGPQGVGFLKCAVAGMHPLIVGGPQEEGRRAGTENVAGVLALVATLEAREAALATEGTAARAAWAEDFVRALPAGSRQVGEAGLWNTVSVCLPELPGCQRWVVKLDKHGVAASTGSACASGQEQISHVLAAMGLEAGEASRVIRFSSGWETTREEWMRVAAVVGKVLAEAG